MKVVNKGLALRFLRVVNESGLNGWGQIYARMPFGDEEEFSKGALFGAVFAKGEMNPEKEAEILVWVDEYYNGIEKGGALGDFWKKFTDKFGEVDSAWVWVVAENGDRKTRVIRIGESGVVIDKGGVRALMEGERNQGKVVVGEMKEGDEMVIWAGGLKDYIDELKDRAVGEEERVDGVVGKLFRNQVGGAGLVLSFLDNGEEEEKYEEEVAISKVEPEIVADTLTSPDPQEIVSERLVGSLRPKDRVVNWWRRVSTRRGILVGRGRPEGHKRVAIGLGVVFLIFLIGSVVFGSLKIKADKENDRWAAFSEPIEKKRLEAESMVTINQVGSKNLLEEARTAFESGKGAFSNTKHQVKIADLEKKLNDSWQKTSGEKEAIFTNQISLELVRQGFSGSRLVWSKNDAFLVMDSILGIVASVGTNSKEIKVVAGKGESSGWTDLTAFGKTGFVLGGSGLGLLGTEAKITPFDSAISEPVALGAFGSSLYLLDKGSKEIFKYTISGDTPGERQRWLKQGESVGVGSPEDLAIDGDIWIVGDEVTVERFRRGVKERFSLSGVPEGAVFSRIAIEREGENMALLDSRKGQVVIFKKEDGSFVSQLSSSQFKEASDIDFDGDGRLWVLTKGTMSEVR